MKSLNVYIRTVVISMIIFCFVLPITADSRTQSVKDDLENAKKLKKTVFLVVTANGIDPENCLKLAMEAQKKLKDAVVITLNRDEKENAEMVSKYYLGSTPLPMIMVIGMNGAAAGGLQEAEASADKLIKMTPSPKKAEALSYVAEKKAVFVVTYRKSFKDRQKVLENVKTAVDSLDGKASYVEIDLDDLRERDFLLQIGVEIKTKQTITIVINNQGKVMGNHAGLIDTATLKTNATSTIRVY